MFLLLACHAKTEDGTKPSGDADPPAVDTPGPCADGSWMGEDAPTHGAIYVGDRGSTEDGSYAHPFHSVAVAVLRAEERGSATVAVFPGSEASVHPWATDASSGAGVNDRLRAGDDRLHQKQK